ncbi:hypothetical protein PENSPDRAFT_695695 [Peniophora sp. CONT]|nr:hypothetical protein PENSPDRAFT_695695 [Peniophora sp. CONT]
MNDMNLKKIRNLTTATIAKYKKKAAIRESRMSLLDAMAQNSSITSRTKWQEQIALAYRRRSIDLANPRAYDPKFMDTFFNSLFITPNKGAAELALIERDMAETNEPGLAKLVINGLQLQIEQLSWQAYEKNHTPMTEPSRRMMTAARTSLKTRITKHNKLAVELLGPLSVANAQPEGDALFDTGVRLRGMTSEGEWETASSRQARQRSTRQPEFYGVDLPSARKGKMGSEILARAGAYEIYMRETWLAQLLHEIRLLLVAQVATLRRTIQHTPRAGPMSQKDTRATQAKRLDQSQGVRVYAQQYNEFRKLMKSIEAAPDFAAAHPEYSIAAQVERGQYAELGL